MIPYLLFFILIIYGECSRDLSTRFIARIILYAYAATVILQGIIPVTNEWYHATNLLIIGSLVWSSIETRSKFARVLFLFSATCTFYVATALHLREYDLITSIPIFSDYSHRIIRESIIAGIAATTQVGDKGGDRDWKLNAYMFLLILFEQINLS